MLARQTLLWHARHSVAPTLAQKVPILFTIYNISVEVESLLFLRCIYWDSQASILKNCKYNFAKKDLFNATRYSRHIFCSFPFKFWDLILLFLSAHSLGFDLDKVQISFCLVRNVFSLSASAFVRLKTCSGQQQISNECNNGSGGPQFFWWFPIFRCASIS